MNSSGNALAGRGLLQSAQEWEVRNRVLAESLLRLAVRHLRLAPERGLDVGCQEGELTDYLNAHTQMSWEGVDPALPESTKSSQGASLHSAAASKLPYPDNYFDCLFFANVFEHIPPDQRGASVREMYRVMRPGAILVGQIPNPYFPIEAHSRMPFMGWLPYQLREKYWRLAPVPWGHDFFSVTPRHLRQEAGRAGLEVVAVSNFNYPPEALPKAARPLAVVLRGPMRLYPWAWQFVLRRTEGGICAD